MTIKSLINSIINKEKNHLGIFLIILTGLSVFMMYEYSVFDLVSYGHDGTFHYNRFLVLMEALKDGSFPVYIDHEAIENYGYASNLFYPNFTLIPFAILGNVIGGIRAFQLMCFCYTILTGILTYTSVYKVYKNRIIGYLSALLYTFCLYRLQDYFARAAIAEAITFTFLPLIFWGLYEIIKGDYKKWYILSIGYSLFILTHVLSTLLLSMAVGIAIIFCLNYFRKEPIRILYLSIAALVTILLSACFLFPFLEQTFSNYFNYQLFKDYPFYRYLGSDLHKILFGVGVHKTFLAAIGIGIILPLFLRFSIKEKDQYTNLTDIFVIASLVVLLYGSDLLPELMYSSYIFSRIQYTFRFFEYCSFLFSVASAYYIYNLLKNNKKYGLIIVIGVVCMVAGLIIVNSKYTKYPDYAITVKNMPERSLYNNYYIGHGNVIEYLPTPATVLNLTNKGNVIYKEKSTTNITNIKRYKNKISFTIDTDNDIIYLPLTYYKGYNAFFNNEEIKILPSDMGVISIPIQQSGEVIVEFSGTFLQKYSIYITLVSILLIIIYITIDNRKNNKSTKEIC